MPYDHSKFSNEIKDYGHIRSLVRYLFKYGDLSTNDLKGTHQFGGSTDFSYHIKRIKNYLDDDRYNKSSFKENDKRYTPSRLISDSISYPINNLTRIFQEHIFDVHHLIFYYTLMQLFVTTEDEEDGTYENDFCDTYDYPRINCNDDFVYADLCDFFFASLEAKKESLFDNGQLKISKKELSEKPFSEETFRKHFNKLKNELGIIIDTLPVSGSYKTESQKINPLTDGKKKDRDGIFYYKLSNDIFSAFTDEPDILNSILDMVCFFYNHSDIAVPGWQLSNTLRTYIYSNYPSTDINPEEEPIYQFTDNNVLNALDSDIFWDLITAIHNHKAVKVDYRTKDSEITATVYPIRVISERQYGRQYLFAFQYIHKEFKLFRLDRILDIVEENLPEDKKYSFIDASKRNDIDNINKELNALYDSYFKNSWNIDIANKENPQTVLIHFKTNSKRLPFLKESVIRRSPSGEILNETETGFDYQVSVPKTKELPPWIRQFGPQATVDAATNPDLYDKIKNDLTEMIKRYEPV